MYLGIDLGTQSVKAVLVNEAGEIIRVAQQAYPISRPQPTWAEQNPDDWWKATVSVVQTVARYAAHQIRAIGLAGQMHGFVALDKQEEVLRPAIIWMDQRSQAEIELQKNYKNWLELAHNQLVTGFAAASLLWMKQHEPAIFANIDTLLTPKDWIRWKLTGVLCTEPSDASATLLFDVQKRQWSTELLQIYGFEPRILPHVVESEYVLANLTPDAAHDLGLPIHPVVVAGAADQAAMLIGCGVREPGQAVLTIGTGGQFSIVTDHPRPDPRLNTFCHAVPNRWYSMGAILAAGYALSWWQQVTNAHLDVLLKAAAQVPAGAEGVIFRPYLNGERTPHLDPTLTASFIGLTGRHGQGHLTRAVLEGVAFAMRDCLNTLLEAGAQPTSIILGGGGGKGTLWRQIMASVLNHPLQSIENTEQTAYGAAMLAAVGDGHKLADLNWVTFGETTLPVAEWVEVYKNGF